MCHYILYEKAYLPQSNIHDKSRSTPLIQQLNPRVFLIVLSFSPTTSRPALPPPNVRLAPPDASLTHWTPVEHSTRPNPGIGTGEQDGVSLPSLLCLLWVESWVSVAPESEQPLLLSRVVSDEFFFFFRKMTSILVRYGHGQ